MPKTRNILFIMCDQLRADYLSCAGHPSMETPNIDALAARGTRFTRAYVQAPVCGPSRMSAYTGRYSFSHGATWNFFPLPVGERTLGDYLRPHGVRTALVGKTHMEPDEEGMKRFGLAPERGDGLLVSECGFEPYDRDDGVHPDKRGALDFAYNDYLRAHGYRDANPWHSFANSAAGPDGKTLSGWNMRNARLPARVKEEHSETAYCTERALAFIREQGEAPWCLHLSYIKPHWPYMAPAPYHAMYAGKDVIPAVRSEAERRDPHPVFGAFMRHREGLVFAREEVRAAVIPTYMGLTRQIDDHLGRLFRFLEDSGRMKDTLIVFTSDHGDFLGDHWLGEKELFYEQAARVPLIVYDPEDGAPRGAVSDDFAESIDLVPTFLDALGIPIPTHVLEGRSLLPRVRRGEPLAREAVFSELDYGAYPARQALGLSVNQARAVMVLTRGWKMVHYDGFAPQLFDLETDPRELRDLGCDPGCAAVRAQMKDRIFDWMRSRKNRIATTDAFAEMQGTRKNAGGDVLIGRWE
ncbi:MAG: alkaline phosphatase family protein [Burkholderiales bacterium]|nr:alkaline phosphatase family protein [Burkholderiales bacterium]